MDNLKLNYLLPPYLTIELSNTCNFHCPMCTLAEKDPLQPTFIKRELFENILREIYEGPLVFSDLRLFWAGEPMLHPDFCRFITLLSSYEQKSPKFKLISMDSNASRLNRQTAEVLCSAGESLKLRLIVSMDSCSSEVYENIRSGGIYQETLANVLNLLDEKKGKPWPKVAVQFIVMPENAHELPLFLEFWKNQFLSRNLEFSVLINASTAEKDGVNLRPLTEQNETSKQKKANALFAETLYRSGVTDSPELRVLSQGGGRYDET